MQLVKMNTPQQANGFDCGVYCLAIAEAVVATMAADGTAKLQMRQMRQRGAPLAATAGVGGCRVCGATRVVWLRASGMGDQGGSRTTLRIARSDASSSRRCQP